MTGAESFLMKQRLADRGWSLRVFRYSSLAEPMERVARRCARYARWVAQRTLAPVHLVGHSLGGLVIYRMFETGLLAPDRFSGDFCRVVLMGSPLRGSQSARSLAQWNLARGLLGRAGARDLTEGLPPHWPFRAQLGILAGDRPRGLGQFIAPLDGPHDGTVAVAETRIDGAADFRVLPVSHTGMWLSPVVADEVAAFLACGRFRADQAGGERSR